MITDKPNCFGYVSTYGWSSLCDNCAFNQSCYVATQHMIKRINFEAKKEILQDRIEQAKIRRESHSK